MTSDRVRMTPTPTPTAEDIAVSALIAWWTLSHGGPVDEEVAERALDAASARVRAMENHDLVRLYECMGDVVMDLATTLTRMCNDPTLAELVISQGLNRGW